MGKTAKLGDVCHIQSGNSIAAKKKTELFTNVVGTPYVATKDVGFDGSIDYENGIYIPQEHVGSFKISPSGSTLICAEGGSAGRKIAFSRNDCCFVNKLFSITPSESLDAKYIFYYALSSEFQSQFKAALHGMIGGVSLNKIKDFTITIPPLAEQQRIVAKLDAAFAEIDKNIENLKNKIEQVESLVNRVLEEELKNAGRENVKLGDICDIVSGQSPKSNYYNKEMKGTPFYQGAKDFGDRYLNEPTVWTTKISKKALPNDILISVRAPVGPLNITKQEICIGRGLSAIREREKVNWDFLFYSLEISIKNIENKSGAVFDSINKKNLQSLLINLPPLEEQKQIVEKLDAINLEKDISINALNSQINNYISLKSSILSQELEGKITA
ncbi:restriction endonuclease subunit S [bacterium]|nr:restriction endonuclease subunit S [bacterium]